MLSEDEIRQEFLEYYTEKWNRATAEEVLESVELSFEFAKRISQATISHLANKSDEETRQFIGIRLEKVIESCSAPSIDNSVKEISALIIARVEEAKRQVSKEIVLYLESFSGGSLDNIIDRVKSKYLSNQEK